MTAHKPATPLPLLIRAQFQAGSLHKKWIGAGVADLPQIASVIRRELKAANAGRIKVSSALITEMRGEAILVGKLRALLRELGEAE